MADPRSGPPGGHLPPPVPPSHPHAEHQFETAGFSWGSHPYNGAPGVPPGPSSRNSGPPASAVTAGTTAPPAYPAPHQAPPSSHYYMQQLHNFNMAATATAAASYPGMSHHSPASQASSMPPFNYSRPLPAHLRPGNSRSQASPSAAQLASGAGSVPPSPAAGVSGVPLPAHIHKGHPHCITPGGYLTPSPPVAPGGSQPPYLPGSASFPCHPPARVYSSPYAKAAEQPMNGAANAYNMAHHIQSSPYADLRQAATFNPKGYYGSASSSAPPSDMATPPPNGNSNQSSPAPAAIATASAAAAAAASSLNSYDQIAAQILNSFAGGGNKHFSQNLIHKDISTAGKGVSQDELEGMDLSSNKSNSHSHSNGASQNSTSMSSPVRTILNTPVMSASSSPAPIPAASSNAGGSAPVAQLHPPSSSQSNNNNPVDASTIPEKKQRKGANEDKPVLKRKKSIEEAVLSLKRPRIQEPLTPSNSILGSVLAGHDPYSFDEEEKAVELGRFSVVSSLNCSLGAGGGGGSRSGAGSTAGSASGSRKSSNASLGPMYKFKNALLSRESRTNSTDSRGSTSGHGGLLEFDESLEVFLSVCNKFVLDLETKPVNISSKLCMESYFKRLAIKRSQKKRGRKSKAEKEAAERARLEAEAASSSHFDLIDYDDDDEDQDLVVAEDEPQAMLEDNLEEDEEEDEDDLPLLRVMKTKNSKAVTSSAKPKNCSKKKDRGSCDNELQDSCDSVLKSKPPSSRDQSGTSSDEASSQKENNPSLFEQVDKKATTTKPKKGGLWALPFVPAMPQKPAERTTSRPASPTATPESSNGSKDFTHVWLQAFGGVKPSKAGEKAAPAGQTQAMAAAAKPALPPPEETTKAKTILDIPPEARRRPKPVFGGLMHFAPDWESKVQRYHEKCRVPEKLAKSLMAKPQILSAKGGGGAMVIDTASCPSSPILGSPLSDKTSPVPSVTEDKEAKTNAPVSAIMPRLLKPEDYDTAGISMPSPSTILIPDPGISSNASPLTVLNVVDSIIEKRKMRTFNGRLYKVPGTKDIKEKRKSFEKNPEEGMGLLPTPGLPLLTQDTTDVLLHSNFGNFRRQTLLRYFDSLEDPDLKAKIIDWKPEVLESKTRHQSNQLKPVISYKEIFGSHKPEEKMPPKKGRKPYAKKKKEAITSPPLSKEELEKPEDKEQEATRMAKGKKTPKSAPDSSTPDEAEKPAALEKVEPSQPMTEAAPASAPTRSAFAEDDYEPTKEEEALQIDLQKFALELLEDNPSWSNKCIIQNLVIWEPIDPVPLVPIKKVKKKYKKHKKRQSGMDFMNSSKKKSKSRDVSRAGSPDPEAGPSSAPAQSVHYSLENVMAESKGWVVDKGAGETILQRAAKMGYPDVIAYALDILKMNPMLKDNAGIPPIHKAAFRGHCDVVRILLRYGVDPNTNVKGTRPLHEALEGGDLGAVHQLLQYGSDPMLYDYSGNMPIDLTEDNDEMEHYFAALLADLHGKCGERWNVAHDTDFSIPKEELEQPSHADEDAEDDKDDMFQFESSSHPLPPFFQLSGKDSSYVLHDDLKSYMPKSPSKAAEAMKHLSTIEISTEDFSRQAHCSLLGYKRPASQGSNGGPVRLVAVNSAVKKLLAMEASPIRVSKKLFTEDKTAHS